MCKSSSSNNTNKLSPQELWIIMSILNLSSNNTNKLSPQEPQHQTLAYNHRSNNTNKLSPQERLQCWLEPKKVQIIQINLVLKNYGHF